MTDASPAFLFDGQSSVRGKKWAFRNQDDDNAEALVRMGHSQTVSQLLSGRGVDPDNAEMFLNPTLRDYLPNP